MAIRINGEEVGEGAIQYELARLVRFYSQYMVADEIRKQMDDLKKKARDQAVGAKLLINEARRLDIQVSKTDVDESLQKMKKNAGGEEAFNTMLKQQNMTEDMMRKGIEQGRRVDLLVERTTAGISDPTEGEMKLHFEEHADEYRKADRVQAQHILIRPASGSDQDRATAKSRLTEIREKLMDGASFAEQAEAFSECPSGKKTGGSLGWVSRGMLIPEFESIVFGMKDEELSEIVETPLGFHIIKKLDHEEGGPATYSEVAEKIRDFLRHARRGAVISSYVEDLKKKAVIEED